MPPEPETTAAWEKLAAARRRARVATTPASDETAPFGFAQRIAAHAMELRRNERLAWWTRWSMRAAFSAGIAAVLVALFSPAADLRAPLLAAPSLEIPMFASP